MLNREEQARERREYEIWQERARARTRRNILLIAAPLLVIAGILTAWAYQRSWGWGYLEGTVVRKDQGALGGCSITVEYEQAGAETSLKLRCTQEEYDLVEKGAEVGLDFEINHMTKRAYLTELTFLETE